MEKHPDIVRRESLGKSIQVRARIERQLHYTDCPAGETAGPGDHHPARGGGGARGAGGEEEDNLGDGAPAAGRESGLLRGAG